MDERTKLRRNDRAADEAWISEFLHESAVGVLATVYGGQPFVNSNIFVYDEDRHAIYLHTARTGRTRDNVEADAKAAFTVYETGRLLPADELKRTSVFRLDIESWSGKRKFVEPDFPGAYLYEDRERLAAEAPD